MISRIRQNPGGHDEYGDPIEWTPTTLVLDGAFTAPRESSEITDRGRSGVIVGLTLYAPVGADVLHMDQIDVDGVLYDVEGEIGTWIHPRTGWDAGIEAALRRAIG